MNKVFLIGRLTNDPELRYTVNNIAVSTLTLAVNRDFTNANGEREADFINVVVWRKQAENVKNHLSKGSKIAVVGSLQVRSYSDSNGKKRYVTEVVADKVEFLDSKPKQSINNDVKSSDEPFKQFADEHQEDFKFKDEEGLDLPF